MYFYHNELSQDESKLIKLRRSLGYEGYGIYWALIERIHRTDGLYIDNDIDALAYVMQVDVQTLTSVIREFGLFEVDETRNVITSVYLESMTSRKPRRRRATKTSNPDRNESSSATAEPSETNAQGELSQSRPTTREVVFMNFDDSEPFEEVEQIDEGVIEPVVEAWNEAYSGTRNVQNLESVKMNGSLVMQIYKLQQAGKFSKSDYRTVFDYNRKQGRYANQFHTIFNVQKFNDLLTRAQEERRRQEEEESNAGTIYTKSENDAYIEKLKKLGLG